MRTADGKLILSATDLSRFLGCRHCTGLDLAVAMRARKPAPKYDDPLLELLWQRGLEHERKYVDTLRSETSTIVDLSDAKGTYDEHIAQTIDAMRNGADVIVQGALGDAQWFGKPDILRKVAKPSTLGAWSYEVADTKLSRETRAGTILQLGLYSEMVAEVQGTRPEHFHVVTPDAITPVHTYRVDDYAAYFRLVRRNMLEAVAMGHDRITADNYPDPVDQCDVCQWHGDCRTKRRADDHLSLVANISRVQRRELESQTVTTLTGLAALPVPFTFKPKRGSIETYERVREQARLQLESRDRTPPLNELLEIMPDRGLCRLPEPSPGDLFLDLEGDPFAAEGGREYLFGITRADVSYEAKWAFDEREEKRAFEWAMDTIAACMAKHPNMHVYHYAPYEPAAFKRLAGRYVTRGDELDAMLRSGRFVDLYAVVRQGLRAGIERYSIKNLEPLYGYAREVDLADASRNLRRMEFGLEMGVPGDVPAEVRAVVEGYNRDDCVSTLRLRDWLESVRAKLIESGTDVPRRVLEEGAASEEVDEKAQRVEALRKRLLDGIPDLRADRSDEHQARWLLAYMLDYHRREDKAVWWEYFRLIELPPEDLFDEREAVAGMEFVDQVEVRKKSFVHRYRYPQQEMEIDPGDELKTQDQEPFGKVVAVDRVARTIDILKGPKRAAFHPTEVFAHKYIQQNETVEALFRIGEVVASGAEGGYRAARSLLLSEAPRLTGEAFVARDGESAVEFAVRVAGKLDESVLAIQGPPGTGKTYCGARMIAELVRQGKKVGVTANSHEVIRNLLLKVAEEAGKLGVPVRIAQKGPKGDEGTPPIAPLAKNEDALAALESGEANVIGATRWLWTCEEFASSVDVLFVDEAGQMSLANVVAASTAAKSVVLLGDPQQLEQPRKGSHPDGVDVSALEHMLRGQLTLTNRGIFLPVTWRMAPSICGFTSELFYESRLESREGLEEQCIRGAQGLPASGLAFVASEHDGNRNFSDEEIAVVADLVQRLTARGARWVDCEGQEKPLKGSDILVVAPYNSQVSRLTERLAETGARVGTVDKFQGKQAPVVIYSMATSRPEDAPRGMEFLYSLNRLNVATSRAQCLAIVVASRRLFEPECRSPRQMKLANGLCRLKELAAT
jgi:predicted RecB family nuclease